MTYKVVLHNKEPGATADRKELTVTADDVDIRTCQNENCNPCPHAFYNFTKTNDDDEEVTVAAFPYADVFYVNS
jgi:hypothetical protein